MISLIRNKYMIMKNLSKTPLRNVLLLMMAVVLVFSCSDNADKRKVVKKEYGEPDFVQEYQFAGTKTEIYIYARKDINRTYELRKTVSGCGGSGEWYIYRMYYTNYYDPYIELYLPPEITHTPIETAAVGERITVFAEIADDEEVVSVTLWYRIKTQEDFLSVRMTSGESTAYTGNIPGNIMTSDGVEYYIEAWDKAHDALLPKNGYYTITTSSVAKGVTYGDPETSAYDADRGSNLVPEPVIDNYSPISQ